MRSVVVHKQNYLKIENKEMMRDAVTDFIVRSLSCSSQSLLKKSKQVKYQPLTVTIQINKEPHKFEFPLPIILEKYVLLERIDKNNGGGGIEPMIIDILELIDKLEDRASCLSL